MLIFVSLSFLLILICGAIYQYIAEKRDKRIYPPIGDMIDIGGYKLHMIDKGTGPVTVVIDSGVNSSSFEWMSIQAEIAKFSRVITYDRAGYAWSDTSPLIRTNENIVKELHTLLENAKIPGPYILIGHSFGGLNMRLFASKYPDKVAGVILIDSGHEDGFERMPLNYVFNKKALRFFGIVNYVGFKRMLNYFFLRSYRLKKTIEKYPFNTQQLCLAYKATIKYINTVVAELIALQESCRILKRDGGNLGNMPLTVIVPVQLFTSVQFAHCLSKQQLDQLNKVRFEFQNEIAAKSLRGKQVRAKNSGHGVHYDQPELIVEVVREMLKEVGFV